MLSDEQIIRMVRKGDLSAFHELVRRHQYGVLKLCRGILGNRDDAEDAAQETFLRALQNINEIKKNSSFPPWMRRIAVNICLRKLASRRPSEDIDEYADHLASPEDSVPDEVFKRMDKQEVRQFVDDLPPIYRTVIALRYSEELSVKEIAEAIDATVTTVHIRLHRAKQMLRERMVTVCL